MSLVGIKFQKYNIYVTKLFALILNLNEEQQRFLLKKAENLIFKEKREYVRKDCRIPVRYITYNRIYRGFIINLSRNGCFMETESPLLVGERILMDIQSNGENKAIRIKGHVDHANRLGIGIEFQEAEGSLSEILGKLLRGIKEF